MIIDVRNKNVVYITINGYTYYIDDSTNEQYIQVFKDDEDDEGIYEFTRKNDE